MTKNNRSQLSSQVYSLPTYIYKGIQIQTLFLLQICDEMLDRIPPKISSKNRQAK
jgi:hypothetical protein